MGKILQWIIQKIEKNHFLRQLTLLDATFLVIGAVIGSGIFMTAGFIAEYLPSPGLILIVWLAGGLITISGALSFAELGAMFPKAGGQYIYIGKRRQERILCNNNPG